MNKVLEISHLLFDASKTHRLVHRAAALCCSWSGDTTADEVNCETPSWYA